MSDRGPHRTERLLRIFDLLPPISYWDTELRSRAANAAFVDFFGVSPAEIEGRHLSEVLWHDLYELSLPYFERTLATGEPQRFDRTTVDASGATRHAQVELFADFAGGELRGVVAIATDVTERRKAELALTAAEARYELLLAAPVGLATLEHTGRMLLINPALAETVGYPIGDLRRCWLVDLLRDGTSPPEREQVERLLTGELGSASVECQLQRRDGRPITVILSVAMIGVSSSLEIGGILALQDISDRKRAEDALRASQRRLEQAEQIAATGTLEWDLVSNGISWSSGLFRLFMLNPEEGIWGFDEGINRHVFPDDRQPLREALERAIADRSSVDVEFRAIRADGRVRVLEAQADVVVDDNGEPLRMIAVMHDITEARLAQQALRNASSHLADRARELQQMAAESRAEQRPEAPDSELSERQLEILQLVAQGLTNAQIAQRLYISETTVKWHVRQILVRTNSSNRAEAVAHVLGAHDS